MVNFNPYETSSLENLLAALQGGLYPNQGYGMLSDILAQQQARAQTRKQNMQEWASTLGGLATMYPRKSAMTTVNAWDTANMVGPHQADTLRDTVRTLYPDGGPGSLSPLFDMSNLPESEEPESMFPASFGDVPSIDQQQDMNMAYNEPMGQYYSEGFDITNPLAIQQKAMQAAQALVEMGQPPDAETIYGLLLKADDTQMYATNYPENAMAYAQLAAGYVQKLTLGQLPGAS